MDAMMSMRRRAAKPINVHLDGLITSRSAPDIDSMCQLLGPDVVVIVAVVVVCSSIAVSPLSSL